MAKTARSQEGLAMSPGEQLIDLVHIDDVVEAYLCAIGTLDNMSSGHQVYAVSSGKPLPLRELVAVYEKAAGVKLPIEWGKRSYRPREVMVPWNRGATLPGWQPKVSLAEGIQRTLE